MSNQRSWVQEIDSMLWDPANRDQKIEEKERFVKVAMEGEPTRLGSCGVSNGKVKQLVNEFYKAHKDLSFEELLTGLDQLFHTTSVIEGRIFVMYAIEKYRKIINGERLFKVISTSWVDSIDHWSTADHLCINVFKYIPVLNAEIKEELWQWKDASGFWRRRLSFTAYLKHLSNPEARKQALKTIEVLRDDDSYYVRKAILWILRSIGKIANEELEAYLHQHYRSFRNKTEIKEVIKYLSPASSRVFLEQFEKYQEEMKSRKGSRNSKKKSRRKEK